MQRREQATANRIFNSLRACLAPLRAQGKPVYLQYIRGGSHNLVKPLQVLAHDEMLVDWFEFWLNGHEASDFPEGSGIY